MSKTDKKRTTVFLDPETSDILKRIDTNRSKAIATLCEMWNEAPDTLGTGPDAPQETPQAASEPEPLGTFYADEDPLTWLQNNWREYLGGVRLGWVFADSMDNRKASTTIYEIIETLRAGRDPRRA